jgi:acyl carrier protein
MDQPDRLKQLLLDFFNLPAGTSETELQQNAIEAWDSFAMVQLIGEIQAAFQVEIPVNDIDQLTSYAKIRDVLTRQGAAL